MLTLTKLLSPSQVVRMKFLVIVKAKQLKYLIKYEIINIVSKCSLPKVLVAQRWRLKIWLRTKVEARFRFAKFKPSYITVSILVLYASVEQ